MEQTTPGEAGHLHLVVLVRGEKTIQSDPFSVAAIPVDWSNSFYGYVTVDPQTGRELAKGIEVLDRWQSDSGSDHPEDLDQVQVREAVTVTPGTADGMFQGDAPASSGWINGFLPKGYGHPDYLYVLLSHMEGWVAVGVKNGFEAIYQTHEFWDKRTGAQYIPVQNSGYIIIKNVSVNPKTNSLELAVIKFGAAVTAVDLDGNHIYSAAGKTLPSKSIGKAIDVMPLPPGDPLVVTTQPPSHVIAGSPFALVVTAENANGTVNTSFHGRVRLSSAAGSLGGTLIVNAIAGVADFPQLRLNRPGSFVLSASAAGLPTVPSRAIDVTAAPTGAQSRRVAAKMSPLRSAGDSLVFPAEEEVWPDDRPVLRVFDSRLDPRTSGRARFGPR
jgi:hypothetical protein